MHTSDVRLKPWLTNTTGHYANDNNISLIGLKNETERFFLEICYIFVNTKNMNFKKGVDNLKSTNLLKTNSSYLVKFLYFNISTMSK